MADNIHSVRRNRSHKVKMNKMNKIKIIDGIPHRVCGGYMMARLDKPDGSFQWCYLHELVIRSFIGPPPPNSRIEHIDGNLLNNALTNLRYSKN